MPIFTPEERLGLQLAGKYRLDRIIGRGGMGVVFAAVHTWTGRPVAVKLLNPELTGDSSLVTRFLREARAAAALAHPNVVEVLDMGADGDGAVYLALEFLHGETLAARVDRRGRLTPAEAARVLFPVMDALRVAHSRGIIHRDLKPENIFCVRPEVEGGDEVPKLLDFGIAKFEDNDSRQTRTGHAMGTPAYMAPEQIRSAAHAGPAADIWSMGVAWFECLSGKLPYSAVSPQEMMALILTQAPMSLREVAPELPAALCDAVDVALRTDPMDRWPTIDSFARALHEGLEGGAQLSHVPPVTSTRARPRVRSAPQEPPVQLLEAPAYTLPNFQGGGTGVGTTSVDGRAALTLHDNDTFSSPHSTLAPLEHTPPRRPRAARGAVIAAATGGALVLAVGAALAIGGGRQPRGAPSAAISPVAATAPRPPTTPAQNGATSALPPATPAEARRDIAPPVQGAAEQHASTAHPTPTTPPTATAHPPPRVAAPPRHPPVRVGAPTRATPTRETTPAPPARPRIVNTW